MSDSDSKFDSAALVVQSRLSLSLCEEGKKIIIGSLQKKVPSFTICGEEGDLKCNECDICEPITTYTDITVPKQYTNIENCIKSAVPTRSHWHTLQRQAHCGGHWQAIHARNNMGNRRVWRVRILK